MDEDLKKRIQQAKLMGYSDEDIQKVIDAKKTNDAAQNPAAQQSQGMGVYDAVNSPQEQPKQQDGIIRSVAKSLVDPAIKYGQMVGGAAYEAVRSPLLSQNTDKINKESEARNTKVMSLINQARKEKDPVKKKALLDQSRAINNASLPSQEGQDKLMGDNPFMSNEDLAKFSDPKSGAIEGAKRIAGMEAYFVPGGKGITGAIKAGGAIGGLTGFSNSDATDLEGMAVDSATGAIEGMATGGAIGAGGKVVRKGSKYIAEDTANKLFSEPTKKGTRIAIKSDTQLGADVLKNGGGEGMTTTGIFNNAVDKINTYEDALQSQLASSKRGIPIAELRAKTKPIVDKYLRAGNVTAAKNITERLDALEQANGKMIPIGGEQGSVANEIKRTLYDEVRNGYGEMSTENKEGIKVVAKAIKEGIATRVKGVTEINKELQRTGRIADSMLEKMTKAERSNALKLSDIAIGGAGVATGMGVPAIGAIALKHAVGSTAGQKTIMNGANVVSNVAEKAVANPIIKTGAIQLGTRTAMGVSDALSSPQISTEMVGDQTANENQNQSNNQLDHNTSNNNINQPESQIVQTSQDGQWVKKSDGNFYSTDGQWKWDQASNDWVANTQTQNGAASTLTKERVLELMANDLETTGGKNIPELKTMYDIASSKDAAVKKSPTQQAREELGYGVDTALQMLDNPNAKPKIGVMGVDSKIEEAKGQFNKGDPSTLAFNKVLSELQASIAKARGGTSFTPNEQALLNQYSPKLGDSEQVIRIKLQALKNKVDYFKNNEVVDPMSVNNAVSGY